MISRRGWLEDEKVDQTPLIACRSAKGRASSDWRAQEVDSAQLGPANDFVLESRARRGQEASQLDRPAGGKSGGTPAPARASSGAGGLLTDHPARPGPPTTRPLARVDCTRTHRLELGVDASVGHLLMAGEAAAEEEGQTKQSTQQPTKEREGSQRPRASSSRASEAGVMEDEPDAELAALAKEAKIVVGLAARAVGGVAAVEGLCVGRRALADRVPDERVGRLAGAGAGSLLNSGGDVHR